MRWLNPSQHHVSIRRFLSDSSPLAVTDRNMPKHRSQPARRVYQQSKCFPSSQRLSTRLHDRPEDSSELGFNPASHFTSRWTMPKLCTCANAESSPSITSAWMPSFVCLKLGGQGLMREIGHNKTKALHLLPAWPRA